MKRSPLVSIFLIVLVDVMGLTIIIPLLPFYAQHYGANPAVVGLLFSSYAVCQLIAGPILGMLSDRFGRKPVLMLSQMGTFTGFLILAFAQNLWLIFLARIIDGFTAGNLTVAQAYISDVTPPHKRAKSFALIGIAFGLGFLLGPAIPAFLSDHGFQYPIFAAAFLSSLSIAGTFFLLPNKKEEDIQPPVVHEGPWFPWKLYYHAFDNRELARLLWQFLSFIFTFAFFIAGFALFAERRFFWRGEMLGAEEVGYLFAYIGFLGIIIQAGFLGKMIKRLGEKKLITAGFLSICIGLGILGMIDTLPLLLLALTFTFFGSSVVRPSLTSLITQKIDSRQQGMVLGLTQSLTSISQITAPLIGGILIQHQWLSAWAWTGAAVAFIGFWLSRKQNSV